MYRCLIIKNCYPVRIRVIFAKYLKVNIQHCRLYGRVTNGSPTRIDAVESLWTTINRPKKVILSHSQMKDFKNFAYFGESERTTLKIRNQINVRCK
jgi:hypothetical protein